MSALLSAPASCDLRRKVTVQLKRASSRSTAGRTPPQRDLPHSVDRQDGRIQAQVEAGVLRHTLAHGVDLAQQSSLPLLSSSRPADTRQNMRLSDLKWSHWLTPTS